MNESDKEKRSSKFVRRLLVQSAQQLAYIIETEATGMGTNGGVRGSVMEMKYVV